VPPRLSSMGGVQAPCCSGSPDLVPTKAQGDEEEPQISFATTGNEEGDLHCSSKLVAYVATPDEKVVADVGGAVVPRFEIEAFDVIGDETAEVGTSTDTTVDSPGSWAADMSALSDDALLKETSTLERCVSLGDAVVEGGEEGDKNEAMGEEDDQEDQDREEDEEANLVRMPEVIERKCSLMHYIQGSDKPAKPRFQRKQTRTSLLACVDRKRRTSQNAEISLEENIATEVYKVGKILGEGTFGVVCACSRSGSDEELAMKMVDKVERPMVGIIKEAQLMYKLSHPNIVKLHDFFDETFFACILMDKYAGGSLLQGMHRNRKRKDRGLDAMDIHHIFKQLVSPLEYLHSFKVLHRDVNADNYLLDRAWIFDPECGVALGDFGLACELKPAKRIGGLAGRKLFWAPELTHGSGSSFPVDVWALGVTSFGLIDGHFPFSSEHEACNQEPDFRFDVHPACKNFILQMLIKDENRRLRADCFMQHAWIIGKDLSTSEIQAIRGGAKGHRLQKGLAFKRGQLRDDVSNRRRMLLERMWSSSLFHGDRKSEEVEVVRQKLTKASLSVPARQGTTTRTWWPLDRAEKAGLFTMQAAPVMSLDEQWLHTITLMLRQYGMDTKSQDNKEQIHKLADEVSRGASRLMLDATSHRRLVRVVSRVELCLRARSSGFKSKPLVLVQRSGNDVGRLDLAATELPGGLRESNETVQEVAHRLSCNVLGLPAGCTRIAREAEIQEQEEEQETSEFSFGLGLQTVCCKSIVQMEVATADRRLLSRMGLPKGKAWSGTDISGTVRCFDWLNPEQIAECHRLNVGVGLADTGMSCLVPAHFGPTLRDLKAHLQRCKLDITPAIHKSLEDLYAEVKKGDASLIESSDGEIMLVIDLVAVQLTSTRTKVVLVESEQDTVVGPHRHTARLPSATRRADENHFFTAWRILGEQPILEAQTVKLNADDIDYFEEVKCSDRLPCLKTVLRKRLIKGVLLDHPACSSP